MKILVTGATGFIGRHLVAHLARAGHDVAGLMRTTSTIPEAIAHLPMHAVDATPDALHAILMRERPDGVVHLAAHYVATHTPADLDALVAANIGFTAHLLEAMADAGCDALVFAASAWQYGEAPANLYAATKNAALALADYYRSAHGLRVLELALYDSYGPDDPRGKLISILKDAMGSAVDVPMSGGEQRVHLVHVDDLCQGFTLACEQITDFTAGERRIHRLPSTQAISVREVVEALNAAGNGRHCRVAWGARPYRPREVFSPWEGAPVLPGWTPTVPLAEGLRRLLDSKE
ncbi:NAD(P)-dependent oxidoreductase [Nitrogeniibacter mangrovi]|uniref:NAD(P)-dependent oxidoreductase n=1 Tax=Nitrogeniibacter mangrovi TaxID=2016596 RepID=A0A6C1B155_9RHOO|nr:NAD(P)-dependent oxidoreductase [Nitrogeniibacter mangrovi]QID17332.1 NAD(P)-dependent oxidoreductase [Nitrogeniibacter mangrovi]